VGLKVMVGLAAVVIAFMGFNEYKDDSEEETDETGWEIE